MANNREVLEETILPKIRAFLAERGVRLSEAKTKITHIEQGFDFLGQTLRKHPAPTASRRSCRSLPAEPATGRCARRCGRVCRKLRRDSGQVASAAQPRAAGLGQLSPACGVQRRLRPAGPLRLATNVPLGAAAALEPHAAVARAAVLPLLRGSGTPLHRPAHRPDAGAGLAGEGAASPEGVGPGQSLRPRVGRLLPPVRPPAEARFIDRVPASRAVAATGRVPGLPADAART